MTSRRNKNVKKAVAQGVPASDMVRPVGPSNHSGSTGNSKEMLNANKQSDEYLSARNRGNAMLRYKEKKKARR